METQSQKAGHIPRWATENWSEYPSDDPEKIEIWGYTGELSYSPGDDIDLHVSCSGHCYSVEIFRDGAAWETVYFQDNLPGKRYDTPSDCYETGCQWPVAQHISIPEDWRPGGYVVILRTEDQGKIIEHEAFFILRSAEAGAHSKILLVLATSTWQAYNNWGGANFYSAPGHVWGRANNTGNSDLENAADSSDDSGIDTFSPRLSTQRPWARGFIRLPEGTPRIPLKHAPPPGWAVRLPSCEWTYANGYSFWCCAAGWASYDGHMARWLERNGYEIDYVAQHDLHDNPDILNRYRCVITTGHDEYWSGPMRRTLDNYIEGGGNYLRLAGNIFWQIRLEDNGKTQVCYKSLADQKDPVRNDPEKRHTITAAWEAQSLAWPAVTTFGANGTRGIYARSATASPRSSGGFTVYRPAHWSLQGTDLYYGDVFGGDVPLVGYEGDGVAYTITQGLPYPTGEDGAPLNLQIIAMALATMDGEDHGNYGQMQIEGNDGLGSFAKIFFGSDSEENRAKIRYGSVVVTHMPKGKGEVFCAGTTEWCYALKEKDSYCEIITHNVLKRFTQ